MLSKLVVCCGDITIFLIFKMAGATILDFRNSKLLLDIGAERVEIHQHAKLCQNRSIGWEDIKNFGGFSRWRQLPSWIFEIVNFYLLTVSAGPRRITVPNFIKNRSFHCVDIAIFWFFKMAAVRHLGFVWGIFGLPTVSTWGSLSVSKNWLWSMQ